MGKFLLIFGVDEGTSASSAGRNAVSANLPVYANAD